MDIFLYFIVGIGVILLGAGIFYVRNFLEKKDESLGTPEMKDSAGETTKKPWEPSTPDVSQGYKFTPDQRRNGIVIAVVVLVIISFIGITFFSEFAGREGTSSDERWSVLSYIPFWFVVLIPFIAARKKKQQQRLVQQQKIFISILVGGSALLIIGSIIFLVLNQ